MAYSYQNPYMNYGNQFYQQPIQPPRFQTPDQQQFSQYNQVAQPISPMVKPTGLQGKSVDSIDVVKATDIPLDYSVSYFPLTDGSAIVTKQLTTDGTSRMVVYKPVELEQAQEKETPKYLTIDEFNEKIKGLDTNKDLKEEIKKLKAQIKSLTEELEDLKDKED